MEVENSGAHKSLWGHLRSPKVIQGLCYNCPVASISLNIRVLRHLCRSLDFFFQNSGNGMADCLLSYSIPCCRARIPKTEQFIKDMDLFICLCFWNWQLNSGACPCHSGAVPLSDAPRPTDMDLFGTWYWGLGDLPPRVLVLHPAMVESGRAQG